MKSRFFFRAGIIGILSGVASGATDDAEVDYGRDWSPYVTLRGGWLFGEYKMRDHYDIGDWNWKRSTESGWLYSAEAGIACFEDRVFLGLELGSFGEKVHDNLRCNPPEVFPMVRVDKISADGKIKHSFSACNFTFKQDIGERAFLYSGVGVGIVRAVADWHFRETGIDIGTGDEWDNVHSEHDAKWGFFGQAFGGLGWYLNDNWSLSVGYRLRYVPGDFRFLDADGCGLSVKSNCLHAAEVGLTYRF